MSKYKTKNPFLCEIFLDWKIIDFISHCYALLGFRLSYHLKTHHLILHVLFEFQIKEKFALKDEAKLSQTKHKEPLVYFCGAKLNFYSMVTI